MAGPALRTSDSPLDRRRVVATVLEQAPADLLVISGLGSPTYDVAACGDSPRNFYLWGAMGMAVPVGLGLALARPDKRVLVITGDGEMLMGLGSLATAGAKRPDNLAVLVLDNEAYGETGGQASHTGCGTDLCGVAAACGFVEARHVARQEDLVGLQEYVLRAPGPMMVVAKVDPAAADRVLPARDGAALRLRFRGNLGG